MQVIENLKVKEKLYKEITRQKAKLCDEQNRK